MLGVLAIVTMRALQARWARSKGRGHAALTAQGIARAKLERAANREQFGSSVAQDVARTAFSYYSRGHASASARTVSLG